MIDHFGIRVQDLQGSKDFYQKTLAPLGYSLAFDSSYVISFVEPRSTSTSGDFWLEQGKEVPKHFAFNAQNRAEVNAFYQAGLAAGARDNGAPGIRSQYHANYYAAFLLDPDGNNIEAVCHRAE